MQRNKKRPTTNVTPQNPLLTALLAGGLGILSAFAMALVAPFLLLKLSDPKSLILVTAAICVCCGGIASGIFCAVREKESPMLTSLMSSGFMFLPLLIFSLIFGGKTDIMGGLIILASLLTSVLLSSYLLCRATSNKKHNMKKIMKRR